MTVPHPSPPSSLQPFSPWVCARRTWRAASGGRKRRSVLLESRGPATALSSPRTLPPPARTPWWAASAACWGRRWRVRKTVMVLWFRRVTRAGKNKTKTTARGLGENMTMYSSLWMCCDWDSKVAREKGAGVRRKTQIMKLWNGVVIKSNRISTPKIIKIKKNIMTKNKMSLQGTKEI